MIVRGTVGRGGCLTTSRGNLWSASIADILGGLPNVERLPWSFPSLSISVDSL